MVLHSDTSEGISEGDLAVVENLENLSSLRLDPKKAKPGFSASALFTGGQAFVILEGILDKAKEQKKLQAELDRAKGFIKGIEKKLQNERFVSNAPESVLQKERDKLESQTQKISNLESSLAELN